MECIPETNILNFINQVIYPIKKKNDSAELEKLAELQWKRKEIRLLEKTGHHGFQKDAKEIFGSFTKTAEKTLECFFMNLKPKLQQLRTLLTKLLE